MSSVTCHILDTGYCTAHTHHIMQGGPHEVMACHSLVALIHHPQRGWGLWDTGYTPRMQDLTRHWPWWIYGRMTPLYILPELAVAAQLPRFGLTSNDIRWTVLSHMHADHIAGLLDFPHATIFVTEAAYRNVAPLSGIQALRRAFIPDLLPVDFLGRAVWVGDFNAAPLPGLGATHDLFGDGTLRLVDLPGHARGQIGMLVTTAERQILLAADGAWITQAIRERRPPSRLTTLFVDDWQAVQTTLNRLHTFALACPDVALVPTHCPEAYAREL